VRNLLVYGGALGEHEAGRFRRPVAKSFLKNVNGDQDHP